MKYRMGSGIIRYIRTSKTFSKFHVLRSSVCFEVPCASKFRVVTKLAHAQLNFHRCTVYTVHNLTVFV